MSGRFSKRGKNPGAVDSWLDSLGYYRKNIAYDETCLFRAASEQIYYTQINHEEIRNTIIQYAFHHHNEFKHLIPNKREWFNRLHKLSVHMVICSEIEIELISRAFKIDLIVFDAAKRQKRVFKYNEIKDSDKVVQICKLGEDHYDAIYDREHIVNTGFCQSLVYGILYENVFELPNVLSTVNAMLHDKDGSLCLYYSEDQSEELLSSNSSVMLAPFPFKVAKALDPNMYRNIEYDSWLETRREFRLGEWYYGDDHLILGTRCVVNIKSEECQCYIQEFLPGGKCLVFLTKLAQRIIVNYDDLRREEDAKPWPLPYRFARSSPTSPTSATENVDNNNKTFRKRKDRKRTEINNNNIVNSGSYDNTEISTLEGCPLVKQESDVWIVPRPKLTLQIPNAATNNEDWRVIPEAQPHTTASSETDFFLNVPEVSISPTEVSTTGIYQGVTNDNHMLYAYNQEYPYSVMPVWSNPPYAVSPDAGIHLSEGNVSPVADTNTTSPQRFMYCTPDSAYSSPIIMTPVPMVNYSYTDRTVSSTPATPRLDVYPFVYSPAPMPTTPIYYQQTPTLPSPMSPFTPLISPVSIASPRPQEFVYPPQLNSPVISSNQSCFPYEVPYYSTPPPYTSSWSCTQLNPQGFIFPSPVTPRYV